MNRKIWTKLFAAAGIAGISVAAHATLIDASVLIERAANNRSLTVRYTGASAALVELRINGESVATRSLDDRRSEGETSFGIDTAALAEGENAVEIRLYNADGKVIGVQSNKFRVDRRGEGPIFLERPKAGATVQGPVEIKLGFRADMRNIYVSFFINDEIKSIRNLAPYVYLWDTEREKNGWHEVQAWVVDDSNNTYKTDKMRLFVNNPGGRTDRVGSAPVSANQISDDPKLTDLKNGGTGQSTAAALNTTPGTGPAKPVAVSGLNKPAPATTANTVAPAKASISGTKPAVIEPGTALNAQNLKPSANLRAIEIPGYEISFNRSIPNTIAATGATKNLALVSVENGTRLPEVGAFQIMLDSRYVNFDVSPRVEKGVPFTPFRHLFQEAGGSVHFEAQNKVVRARGLGKLLWFKVGDDVADVDGTQVKFELAPFIESGRVLVPMSFMVDALNVKVQYDPNTGHILVTSETNRK